jgi:thiol peroxidase
MKFTFKGTPYHTSGDLPAPHTQAPDFHLVNGELADITLRDFKGKKKLIATVPSLDTGTCSTEAKHLNEYAKKHPQALILIVSADLPFAQKRFCSIEHIHNIHPLSMMRNKDFGKDYGVLIQDGPLAGLLARSLILIDEKDRVIGSHLVTEVTNEPDYHLLGTIFG